MTPAEDARIKRSMKNLFLLLPAIFLAGCAGPSPKGSARFDAYDAVRIEQMTGNSVSRAPFQKTVVCLNARREARSFTEITNVLVTSVTNQVVLAVTNVTVSVSTNFVFTTMTNLAPAQASPVIQVSGDAAAASETNAVPAPVVALSTNLTVSEARNNSGTSAPNQRQSNNQVVRTLNNQFTTTSNNLSIAAMTNLVVTAETNVVVVYSTNSTVTAATNLVVAPTNGMAYDYFLFTEILAPADFTPLQQGETLVLLVDGARYAFTNAQSSAAFLPRRGFSSALYRTPPETLVALANAKEIRLRVKGANSVIEREMSASSRENFRRFVVKFFSPAPESTPAHDTAGERRQVANR